VKLPNFPPYSYPLENIFGGIRANPPRFQSRIALGPKASDVLRLVIWREISLTLIGATLGLVGALALTRILKNLLFKPVFKCMKPVRPNCKTKVS
jgi:hypothetical protein